jgi:hypothetical protein
MTPARAAAVVGGVTFVAAWLASATGLLGVRESPPPTARVSATSGAGTLAADVQAQAARLRERLSRAPVPQPRGRNPFRFESRRPIFNERPIVAAVVAEPAPPGPVVTTPPALRLEGLAERDSAGGRKRIAILSGFGQVFFVAPGDTVLERYRVVAIGADAIELQDLSGGTPVRLALR